MSKINVTAQTFPNIVVAYLFDKLLHPDEVSVGNELFDKFVVQLKKKGFAVNLRDYYLNMDSQDRLKFKLIKDGFEGVTTSNTVINIVPEKFEKKPETQKDKKKKGGIIRKMLKKLVSSNELSKEEKEYLKEEFEIIFEEIKLEEI